MAKIVSVREPTPTLEVFDDGYRVRAAMAKLRSSECTCLRLNENGVEQAHDYFNRLCPAHDYEVEKELRAACPDPFSRWGGYVKEDRLPPGCICTRGYDPTCPLNHMTVAERLAEPEVAWSYRSNGAPVQVPALGLLYDRPWWQRALQRLRWFWETL